MQQRVVLTGIDGVHIGVIKRSGWRYMIAVEDVAGKTAVGLLWVVAVRR
jgi:hypothetical protein